MTFFFINAKYYLSAVFFLYLTVLTIQLLIFENELISKNTTILLYLHLSPILYFGLFIYSIVSIISNYFYYVKHEVFKENDNTLAVIIISLDSFFSCVYYFFNTNIEAKDELLKNKLFLAYLVPKLTINTLITCIVLLLLVCSLIAIICFKGCFVSNRKKRLKKARHLSC